MAAFNAATERSRHGGRFTVDPTARRAGAARLSREQVVAAQRMRVVAAMVQVVCERGASTTTVGDVVARAGVSRKTLYRLFEDRDECLRAAFEHALALARRRAREASSEGERWIERVRFGLSALLRFFDDEPELARLLVVESAAAGPAVLARRGEVLEELALIVDEGRQLARRQPPPLTAEGVVGGVLGVVAAHLVRDDPGALHDLLNPLMSIVVLPYRGESTAQGQLSRRTPPRARTPSARVSPNPLDGLPMRMTYRTLAVLAAISAEPGLSNFEVSERAGIADKGQISKLLSRLSNLGLAENTGRGQALGAANEWQLTPRGAEVEAVIRAELTGARELQPGRAALSA
jgi:AcrR family transcriptional regulator